MIRKNGAPDLWYGGRLYEVKRGADRLSDAQKKWHDHHFLAFGEFPRIVYFPNAGGEEGFVFRSYAEFESYLASPWAMKPERCPELRELFDSEYGNLQEGHFAETTLQVDRSFPAFNEPVHGGESLDTECESGGASKRDGLPHGEW